MKTFDTYEDARDYSNNNPSDTVECKSYFSNGQLWQHYFYVNGKKHGELKSYHDNGKLYAHCFYVDGELHGEYKSYYHDGKLWKRYFHVYGEETNFDHLKDGSYKSLCIKKTLFDGNVIDEDI